MKTSKQMNQKRTAFTLIEMVGVLAVIAILMALLVPKIFAAIQDSRISNSVASLNSVKAASMSWFGKNGSFPVTTTTNFDMTLIKDGFLERPFTTRIGPTNTMKVVAGLGGTAGYKLDGTTVSTNSTTVECKIEGVDASDALELSTRMDGPTFSAADSTAADDKGRVIYAAPVSGAKVTVYVYLAHK